MIVNFLWHELKNVIVMNYNKIDKIKRRFCSLYYNLFVCVYIIIKFLLPYDYSVSSLSNYLWIRIKAFKER